MKMLEGELGPITGLPGKGWGIVDRLPVGAAVQKLCTRAIETLESMLNGALTVDSQIQSESTFSFFFYHRAPLISMNAYA
jgi:hypothetical protein